MDQGFCLVFFAFWRLKQHEHVKVWSTILKRKTFESILLDQWTPTFKSRNEILHKFILSNGNNMSHLYHNLQTLQFTYECDTRKKNQNFIANLIASKHTRWFTLFMCSSEKQQAHMQIIIYLESRIKGVIFLNIQIITI